MKSTFLVSHQNYLDDTLHYDYLIENWKVMKNVIISFGTFRELLRIGLSQIWQISKHFISKVFKSNISTSNIFLKDFPIGVWNILKEELCGGLSLSYIILVTSHENQQFKMFD